MSINGALQVGRSALAASQAAIQVAGNNMANAATEGFHRRSVLLAAAGDEIAGRSTFVGTGVTLQSIKREVDSALQSRLRDAISHEHGALIDQRFLASIETLQNELTDNDLSSVLSTFFNGFSELANNPEDHALRALVIEQGVQLADRMSALRGDYGLVQQEVDRSLGESVRAVNQLLEDVSRLNAQITQIEGGSGGEAAALRDQRDLLIDKIAEHVDVSVIEQGGVADVFIGSIPVLLAGESRGIELRKETINGQLELSIRVAADGTTLDVQSGRIGALMRQRDETVRPAIDDLNLFAQQLIFEVNRVHSQGQGRHGFEQLQATYGVDDTTVNLNADAAGLDFAIANGSFFIHITHKDSGTRTTHQINVDGDAMSLDDLINEINIVASVPNVTAGVGLGGTLTLDAASGYEITFSDDTSGALAALGLNTFFVGKDAATIGINQVVQDDPNLVAAGAGHVAGSNGTALALANLQDADLDSLNGRSIRGYWQDSVATLGVATGAAGAAVESSVLVRESLSAQMQAVSGVSLDEESINLLTFQRQFQAAARFISVIDEMLQTLLTIA